MTSVSRRSALAPGEGVENGVWHLRLYIAGTTPNSTRAVINLKRICDEHLRGRYDLEVIDLYRHPQLAQREQIVAVPTLIKRLPPPMRRVIGDMSDTDDVLEGLDVEPLTSPA